MSPGQLRSRRVDAGVASGGSIDTLGQRDQHHLSAEGTSATKCNSEKVSAMRVMRTLLLSTVVLGQLAAMRVT